MAEEDKDIIEEIEDIVDEKIDKIPPIEFPEVQKVEVTNLPETLEQKAPVVNVKAPVVNVPPPIVNIPPPVVNVEAPESNKEVLTQILEAVTNNKPIPTNIDFSSLSEEMKRVVDAVGKIQMRGGGGISSKRNLQNTRNTTINPSVAVKDEETLSADDPQGTVIAGKRDTALGNQIAEYIGVGGIQTDALKVLDENNHILKEVVRLLKANNSHQEILTDAKFDGTE